MLEVEELNRIRETVTADIGPRDATVLQNLQAVQRQLAAKGMARSGNELHERARVATDELDIRAGLIWGIIRKCHDTFGRRDSPQLLADLQQQLREYVTAHAITLTGIVDPAAAPSWPRDTGNYVRDAISTKRDQLIAKYQNDAYFYVRAAVQTPAPAAAAAGGIVVTGGNVTILTGDYSTANINIDSTAASRLAQANTALIEAIQNAPDMAADQRERSLDIAKDLETAATAAKPNGPKILGLLGGLSSTVQTVASIKPAWDALKAAAAALGINLPF
jgi:hypothetical protein